MSAFLRLALTGDSILQRRLLSCTDLVIRPLFELVRGADVAFTNLEVLPNDYRGDPALESGRSHFGAPAWVLDELQEAGFGACGVGLLRPAQPQVHACPDRRS